MYLPASEKISFLFAEKGYLEVDGHSVVLRQDDILIHFPVGATSVVFIEPGTVVTHAAVKACAEAGCLLLWVGEAGVRCYASGNPGGAAADNLLRQASIRLSEQSRLQAARTIFNLMFGEPPPQSRSVEQLRGIEGAKVKALYREIAENHGVAWGGRDQRNALNTPLNRAISTANAALYGVTEAVILAMGYSPSIGIVHSGNARSFVFDVSDTVKFRSVVPMALKMYSENCKVGEPEIRRACRDLFKEQSIVRRLVSNVQTIMGDK